MKKIFMLVCMVLFVFGLIGCAKEAKVMSADELVTKLKDADLPIGDVIVYTEKTDANEMLGRPNQYISKASFIDTRLDQSGSEDPVGGSIETFNNATDLKTRKEYLESVFVTYPVFTEYLYVNDNYLLRVNKGLTSQEAVEYESAFMK